MTTTYEAAVVLVEQLSSPDQARLVALLARRLQHAFQLESVANPADEPAFWHTPIDGDELTASTRSPAGARTSDAAHSATQAMMMRWFGVPLSEEEARDLVMSESIAEWNLDP